MSILAEQKKRRVPETVLRKFLDRQIGVHRGLAP